MFEEDVASIISHKLQSSISNKSIIIDVEVDDGLCCVSIYMRRESASGNSSIKSPCKVFDVGSPTLIDDIRNWIISDINLYFSTAMAGFSMFEEEVASIIRINLRSSINDDSIMIDACVIDGICHVSVYKHVCEHDNWPIKHPKRKFDVGSPTMMDDIIKWIISVR